MSGSPWTQAAPEALAAFKQRLFEDAPDCLALLDLEGRLLALNRFGLALIGRADPAPLIGEAWLSWWDPDHRAQAEAALQQAAAGTLARFDGRAAIGGSASRWWSVALCPMGPVAPGGSPMILAPHREISAMKAQEAELAQRALFARRLVGIVSHDLRSPIASVLLDAQRLERHGDDPQRRQRLLGRIVQAARRADRMVHDLLDFTQAQLGEGMPVRRAPCAVADAVMPAIEELRSIHPERRIVYLDDGGTAYLDRDRFAQVVVNLTGNALRYSPADAEIRVTTHVASGQLVLTVHNAGVPIDPALLPTLFDPLRRGDDAGAGRGNIGLGLFIVRMIVAAHGGEVTVTSTAAAGTTFTARLPAAPLL